MQYIERIAFAMFPQRPRAHEIETESRNFVRSALPTSWIVEDVDLDYGTDLRVEIVVNHSPSGLLFLIQLKAHEKTESSHGFIVENLNVSQILYYQRLVLPVLLVVYHCATRSAFFLDMKEYARTHLAAESPGWESQKTVTVRIPMENMLVGASPKLLMSVREFFQRHGLWRRERPLSSAERISGLAMLKLARIYPARKSFPKLIRDIQKDLEIRKGVAPILGKARAILSGLATLETVSGELLAKLIEPSKDGLASAARLTEDENLLALLDSPWCRPVDPYFRALLLSIRIRRNQRMTKQVNPTSIEDSNFCFALLEELLAVNPFLLLEIRGLSVESVIRSTGEDQFVRTTSFRFLEAGLNKTYEEFCGRQESREWSEVVVTSEYYALARLAGLPDKGPRPVTAKAIESRSTVGSFVLSVLESPESNLAYLLDVPIVRKRVSSPRSLMSVFSEATNLEFRGGILNSLQMSHGQKVGIQPLPDLNGGGSRIVVDGIPVLETRLGVDVSKMELPPEAIRSVQNLGSNSPFPRTILLSAKSDVEHGEITAAINQVVEILRQRYDNLRVEPSISTGD